MNRSCPRCQSPKGRYSPDFSDSSVCLECGQRSTNAEWARGAIWTQEEIDEMMKVRK